MTSTTSAVQLTALPTVEVSTLTRRPSAGVFAAIPSVLAGAVLAARAALLHVVRLKLRHGVERLNAGDHRALLAGFADDAVLHFHEGAHRWSGTHVGTDAIERFLQDFVGAGLHGELGRTWFSGPPRALQLCVRFDDEAHDRTARRSTRTASSSGHGPVGARSSSSATSTRTQPASPIWRLDFRTSAYSGVRRPRAGRGELLPCGAAMAPDEVRTVTVVARAQAATRRGVNPSAGVRTARSAAAITASQRSSGTEPAPVRAAASRA